MNCIRFLSRLALRHARAAICVIAAVTAVASGGGACIAGPLVVNEGWDLFHTLSGTTYLGHSFTGVSLGTYDFGFGAVNVGNTDTIVHRLDQASVPGPVPPSDTAVPIDIEMVALQLVSQNQIDLGAGLGFYYVTLQSGRGGPASLGEMTITFDTADLPLAGQHGTFDSFFDVYFDVRFGALNGAIVASDSLHLTADNVPWGRLPPAGALEILGVNSLLNGVDRTADFWPVGSFIESHPGPGVHRVTVATPEPSSWLLGISGAAGLVGFKWRSRRRLSRQS